MLPAITLSSLSLKREKEMALAVTEHLWTGRPLIASAANRAMKWCGCGKRCLSGLGLFVLPTFSMCFYSPKVRWKGKKIALLAAVLKSPKPGLMGLLKENFSKIFHIKGIFQQLWNTLSSKKLTVELWDNSNNPTGLARTLRFFSEILTQSSVSPFQLTQTSVNVVTRCWAVGVD